MALLPFVGGQVANHVAVYAWAVVEISMAVGPEWFSFVSIDVCLLGGGLQCFLVQAAQTL